MDRPPWQEASAGRSGRILAPQTLPNPRQPAGVGERADSAATWLGQGAHHGYLPLSNTQKPRLPSKAQRSQVSYVCVSVALGGTLFRRSVLSQEEKQGGSRKRHVCVPTPPPPVLGDASWASASSPGDWDRKSYVTHWCKDETRPPRENAAHDARHGAGTQTRAPRFSFSPRTWEARTCLRIRNLISSACPRVPCFE